MYPVASRRIRTKPMFLGDEPQPSMTHVVESRMDMLADEDLQKRLEERMRAMERTMKRELIKAAATQAAINLSLNAVPIVGSALSIVSAFTLGHQAERYQRKLEEYGQNAAERVQRHLDNGLGKLETRLGQIIEEEYPKALESLFGPTDPSVEGFQGLGLRRTVRRVTRQVERSAHQVAAEVGRTAQPVADEIRRAGETIQEGIDVMRGKRAYEKGKEEIDKIVREQKDHIDKTVAEGMAEMEEPGFRPNLRLQIIAEVRKDPEFRQLEQEFKAANPGLVPRIPSSARDRFRLIVAASAGVGLMLMMR